MNVYFFANVLGYHVGDVVELDPDTPGLPDAIAGGYAADAGAVPPNVPQLNEVDEVLITLREGAAPTIVEKFDAGITLTGTGAWADLDPGGTAASRPLDIVRPNCRVGMWMTYFLDVYAATNVNGYYISAFPIVAGAPSGHHLFGHQPLAANYGPVAWQLPASNIAKAIGPVDYQIKAGDLEADNSLRMRLRFFGSAATSRALLTGVAGFGLRFGGRGPFGVRPAS